MNHRAMQRTLFRMQMDAAFAIGVTAREPAALASVDLDEPSLALICAADLRGIGADKDGRRRAQVLGNILGEFRLTHFVAAEGACDGFLSSYEFHDAVRNDLPFMTAFERWSLRSAEAAGDPIWRWTTMIEGAMSRTRRLDVRLECVSVPPGAMLVSPLVQIVEVGAGAIDWTAALRWALDQGRPPSFPPSSMRGEERESGMIVASRERRRHGRRDVQIERLAAPVAALLRAAMEPLDRSRLPDIAKSFDAEPDDLDTFVDALIGEGILLVG